LKKIILTLLISILIVITSILGVLFFRPALIINPKNLAFVLHKTSILKSWSWKQAKFTHEWIEWNRRNFSGEFDEFCLQYESATYGTKTCLNKISWNIQLEFAVENGFKVKTIDPLFIRSDKTHVTYTKSAVPEKSEGPPDLYKYWRLFWSDIIPDMDFKFSEIHFKNKKFDLSVEKKPKEFMLKTYGIVLLADPTGFEILPPHKYPIPKKLPLAKDPVEFIGVKLAGKVKEDGVPMKLTGKLESIDFWVDTFLKFPLSKIPLHDLLLETKGQVSLKDVKKTMSIYGPKPYTQLPAPFNAMNGDIITDISFAKGPTSLEVVFNGVTNIDLKGEKQSLVLDINTGVPLNLETFKPVAIDLGIDFKDVQIQMPRLSKKSPPPQFVPDGRFKKSIIEEKQKKKNELPKEINILAGVGTPLKIKTNLLDEILRLNFDIKLIDGKMKNGFLKILPLKTTVFKRPIKLEGAKINFSEGIDPVIDAIIKFPLPEYKITLKLEGPVSKPRYAFESDPPLPQNDIYAVLLFGRPLADLNPDDKTAANKTNQLLSQGILSLSVLYFLSGSPVEYVGYDPGSKNATAQFGLGRKSSLRVGGGQEGINSTAIRRSLGKGWYLDTSVQNSSATTTNSQTKNYGVLLERIISY
jgi:hypothetical protein